MRLREKQLSYDDYRQEIAEILQNNRRIKITDVLLKCNISRGNFYMFMKGGVDQNGIKVNTLSYEKLDTLLNELRRQDSSATNRQLLQSLSTFQLNNYIQDKFISNPKLKDIDFEKWLDSTDEDLIYKDKEKKNKK